MVELPEAYVLAKQLTETVTGRTIAEAVANHSPHGFAFYNKPAELYGELLAGQKIVGASAGAGRSCACGGNVEIECADKLIILSTPIRYHAPGAKRPDKHQLFLRLDDGAYITCTVQMWGAMMVCEKDGSDLPDNFAAAQVPEFYSDAFSFEYFQSLAEGKGKLSAKAFLATEQRIPGLGNGVTQDILYNAKIHPKQRLDALTPAQFRGLYDSTVSIMAAMRDSGGRDTEKDLFGKAGGYQTKLSNKTKGQQCPACGREIIREAYLGGNIYFCPECQPYEKKKG